MICLKIILMNLSIYAWTPEELKYIPKFKEGCYKRYKSCPVRIYKYAPRDFGVVCK